MSDNRLVVQATNYDAHVYILEIHADHSQVLYAGEMFSLHLAFHNTVESGIIYRILALTGGVSV